jgi:hypothetical protein
MISFSLMPGIDGAVPGLYQLTIDDGGRRAIYIANAPTRNARRRTISTISSAC